MRRATINCFFTDIFYLFIWLMPEDLAEKGRTVRSLYMMLMKHLKNSCVFSIRLTRYYPDLLFLNHFKMSLATSCRSSSCRTSTNSFSDIQREPNFSIKSLVALPPSLLFSFAKYWMSSGETLNRLATCFQFFWSGEESKSSRWIKSSISYRKSASPTS